MKLTLRHKLPVVLGVAIVMAGASGAAAYALVAQSTDDGTGAGNSLPTDANHPATAEPKDDRGVHAEPGDDRGTDELEVGDDSRSRVSDDPTPDAVRSAEDRRGSNSGSDDSTEGHSGSGSSGSGSDDSSRSGSGGSDESGSDDSRAHGSDD